MSRTIDVVWIPGLCSDWLDQGAMPRLREGATARATLRCGFPAVPAAIEATILSGRLPTRHGHLGHEAFEERQAPLDLSAIRWPRLQIHRWTPLWDLLRLHGPATKPVLDAVVRADEQLAPLLAQAGRDHVVVVCGGPAYRSHDLRQRVELPEMDPATVRVEGGVLRVIAPGPGQSSLRVRLLRTAGVERVLQGRALQLWGADHPQAGDLVAVAEPEWSFASEAISYGSPATAPAVPVVVVFGGRPQWPTDVHDVRLAPTFAAFLGESPEDFDDSPLDL